MNRTITAFPAVEKLPVTPVERPVVPKAEQTSKRISVVEKSSMADSVITADTTSITAIKNTVSAFMISSWKSSRRNTLTAVLPCKIETMLSTSTAKVVVRMPPPQLLGEAPINISRQKNRSVTVL